MSWQEAAVRWYAVLVGLTWGWAPLVRLVCSSLADRGATVARPLALLGVVYPAWLFAALGLLPYSTAGLWATLGVGAALGWFVAIRRGLIDRAWLRSLVAAEVVSLAAFAAYVWLRGFTPEILYTEKPMDSAFLAASALTERIPPPDPWFAGEPINYYYLGYLLHGALARMAAVPSTTAFNLALATTFAAALTVAAGLGFDAARPWLSRTRALAAGGLAAFLLVGVGNLYAAVRLLRTPAETLAADWWDKQFGVGWRASRIVCDASRVRNDCEYPHETINEFPFFSFLLGDLHPHVVALPFTLVALTLALGVVLRRRHRSGPLTAGDWMAIGVTGAVAGALYAMNSWDFPTYLVVGGVAVGASVRLASPRSTVVALAVLAGSAILPWSPFFVRFAPPTGGDTSALPGFVRDVPVVPGLLTAVGLHAGERTSIGEFLTIFGVPYALALWLIGTGLLQRRGGVSRPPLPRSIFVFVVPAGVLALLLPAPVLVLCGVPLIGAALLLGREPPTASPRGIATALFALGFTLAIAVELFYIRDAFDSRMNTLFKVYYQVWTLFAVAAALAAVVLWREATPRRLARPAILAFVTVALAAGSVYPALASYRWTEEFSGWDGLDGIAYVGRSHPDELAAIRWVQENAGPDDVVLEAAGCSYQPNGDVPFNRVSAFSGAPTVIGWGNNHQPQWRSGQPSLIAEVPVREADVARIYAEPEGELARRYGVTLLFVGRYEREEVGHLCAVAGAYPAVRSPGYPGHGWEVAFESGDVRVYRRADA